MSKTFSPGQNLVKATGAEVVTGTADDRYVTPSGVTSRLAAPGDIGGTTACTDLKVDNVEINGNTISTTDSNGSLTLAPNGSGAVALADKVLSRPTLKDYAETVNALGNVTGNQTINIENGNVTTLAFTSSAACTFTFSNPSPTGSCSSFTLVMTQHSTAAAITWPASKVRWPSGTAPTVTGASKRYVLSFFTVDADMYDGFLVGDQMATP